MYLLQYKCSIVLLWLIFLTLFIYWSIDYLYLSNHNLFYQTYANQLGLDRITKMIEQSRKWQWVSYILIPIIFLIRIGFTATCLYIGCFIAELKIDFGKLFKIALLADFVFILASFSKLVILIFFKNVNTLEDLQFQPLSLLELFDRSSVEPYLIYPLSLISIFELLYWLVLARLLGEVIKQPFDKTLKTVMFSYGSGLLLWVLFGMFLTLNMT